MSGFERLSKEPPTDILVEILSRLPLKSFNRFKTVSKSWLGLSSDPYYSKKFRKFQLAGLFFKLNDTRGHRSSVTHFATLSAGAPLLDPTILTNFPHHNGCDLELLDCCNGLLLFRCQTVDPPCFYVSNPFTKKWIPIPRPKTYDGRFVLAYDPSVSPHFQILFYEISKRNNNSVSLSIISSLNGKWKQSKVVWPNREDLTFGENLGSVLLKETVYLLVRGNILAVKLKEWSFYMIQLPDITTNANRRIGKCKGKLQYVSSTTSMIQIWALGLQSEKEWILNYKLDVQKLFGIYIRSTHLYPRPIQVHPDHDVMFLFCWKDESTRAIVSYDLRNGETEEVCIIQNKFEKSTFYYVPSFSDCVSVNISALK